MEDDELPGEHDGGMDILSDDPTAPNTTLHGSPSPPPRSTTSSGSNSSNKSSISSKGRGVCRIEVTKVEWNPLQPWQRLGQTKSSGTGFVIEGERLLTNAHVVKSAIDIRVHLFGSTRRFAAKVQVYAPEVDLAILILADPNDAPSFFIIPEVKEKGQKRARPNLALEFATELPALQETIQVVGYPTGGKTICVTEGVVSRLDILNNGMFAIQVDSAINPGNSGGPALNRHGQVTGIAFRKRASSSSKKKSIDNIGYLIPSVVVQTFLGRIHDQNYKPAENISNSNSTNPINDEHDNNGDDNHPKYTLDSSIPFRWHSLENKSLRLAQRLPDNIHGILITSVCESVVGDSEESLQNGDVVTSIDGVNVADDGQVILRDNELIQHAYLLKIKPLNQPLHIKVWREGKHVDCPPIFLRDIPTILPRWENVDCQPNYLILGACVLLPYTYTLRQFHKCGNQLKADGIQWCRKWPREWENKKELVVLTDILAHELTFSYQRAWRKVTHYNGVAITSLEHLRTLWKASCEESKEQSNGSNGNNITQETDPIFARLQLDNDDDLVFEVSTAMKAQTQVMKTYEIPKSHQILPPCPNYCQ